MLTALFFRYKIKMNVHSDLNNLGPRKSGGRNSFFSNLTLQAIGSGSCYCDGTLTLYLNTLQFPPFLSFKQNINKTKILRYVIISKLNINTKYLKNIFEITLLIGIQIKIS